MYIACILDRYHKEWNEKKYDEEFNKEIRFILQHADQDWNSFDGDGEYDVKMETFIYQIEKDINDPENNR